MAQAVRTDTDGAGTAALSGGTRIRRIDAKTAALFAGLVAVFLEGWMLTQFAYPAFVGIAPAAREATVWANAATLVALALTATWQPHLLKARAYRWGALVLLAVGTPLTAAGLWAESAPSLVAGAVALSMGRGLVTVLVCVGCAQLEGKSAARFIAVSYLVAFVLRELLVPVPATAGIAVFYLLPFAALTLGARVSENLLAVAFSAEAPAERAITKPSTFLPFGHQFFVALLVFRMVYGFTVMLGADELGTPVLVTAALAVFTAVSVWAFLTKRELDPDRLFDMSTLLVLAGFLMFFLTFAGNAGAAALTCNSTLVNTLLFAGAGCFEIMAYYALAALARRNIENCVVVFAWGIAMYAIGVAVGAFAGRMATSMAEDGGAAFQAAAAAVVQFAFVAFAAVCMRGFSFKDAIGAVEAAETIEAPAGLVANRFDDRCEQTAKRYNLTPRELDVLRLLAQGRNVAHIQKELVLARNTIKVHVRHIYTKLGVHSQQELIDLVVE